MDVYQHNRPRIQHVMTSHLTSGSANTPLEIAPYDAYPYSAGEGEAGRFWEDKVFGGTSEHIPDLSLGTGQQRAPYLITVERNHKREKVVYWQRVADKTIKDTA